MYFISIISSEEGVRSGNEKGHKESATSVTCENEEDMDEGFTGTLLPARDAPSWMWEGFSIDDYNPKPQPQGPQPKIITPKLKEDKRCLPKVTVPQPFKMTLREESEGQLRKAWEETANKPTATLPRFKANPVPKSNQLPLYDKIVEECERQRKVLYEKRRDLMLAMQQPFNLGSKVAHGSAKRMAVAEGDGDGTAAKEGDEGPKPESSVPVRSYKDILKRCAQLATRHPPPMRVEKKLTFQPVINRTIPDFGRLHHRFEDRLRSVRQGMHSTVPQPFSFQVNAGGDQTVSTSKETQKHGKKDPCPVVKWELARILASSQRLTKSALLREEAAKKRLVTREKRLRAEQQKSEAGCSLQKKVAKWLNAQKQRSTARAQRQQQNYRKEMKVRSAEYQSELADMMERVNSRPLLLQRHWQTRREADKRFSLILERAGLDEALLWSKAMLQEQGQRLQLEATEEA
uniref:Protein FAM161A n=1 Tax=Oncorhynchus kisutch TaxID=8019 RepID=A0A8C7JPP7_ONCKI